MAGRRTKLTQQMAARIVANLRQSGNLENAAAREGVGRSTVYDWMQRGRTQIAGALPQLRACGHPDLGGAHRHARRDPKEVGDRLCDGSARARQGWPSPLRPDGNQIFKDKVFRPNRRAIEWKLMLLDRRTYLEKKDPWFETASTETPETETPEKEAPHKGLIDLIRAVRKKDPNLFEPMAPRPRIPRPSRRSHGSRGRPLGRRTKLTPEIQARIIRYFEECSNITDAGLRAGISKVTLFEWLQRGKREGERRYREFFQAFDLARAEQVAAFAVRHHQLAMGGVVPLPVLDRFGRQRYDATGKPLYRKVLLRPNAAALAWELCVLDPERYNLPTRPAKSTRPRKPRRKPELSSVDAFLRDV